MTKKETMVKKTSFSLKNNAASQDTQSTTQQPSSQQAARKPSSTPLSNDKSWSKDWRRFVSIADEMKSNASSEDKGVQIWLDTRIKTQLEMLRASGMKYPVRQLLNAAMKVFLENCADDVRKQLENLKSIG